MLYYTSTLNLVRLAIKHKRKNIKIRKTKRSERILNILLKLNIVSGLAFCPHSRFTQYLVYCNLSFNKQIHTFLKPSRVLPVKLNALNKIAPRYSTTSIYLTTSKGILSLKEATALKIGGVLLFRVF